MRQIIFACQPSFEKFARASRREQFLNSMDAVVPWFALEALIEPHYPKAGNARQPVGLGIMLRIYFLQHWFNLSDPGAEDALCESPVLRGFAGVDLGRAAAPAETTVVNFRHLLEKHDLCGNIFDAVNLYLDGKGIRISTGIRRGGSIRRSSLRRRRPRTRRSSATPRCIRPRREISITSGPRRISASIARKVWCTRSVRRRPRYTTNVS